MTVSQAGFLLFIFGICFNLLIDREIAKDPRHGLTAIWVVIGVAATLLVCALVNVDSACYILGGNGMTDGQQAAWLLFRLFICSGLPMVFGSFRRYLLGNGD